MEPPEEGGEGRGKQQQWGKQQQCFSRASCLASLLPISEKGDKGMDEEQPQADSLAGQPSRQGEGSTALM